MHLVGYLYEDYHDARSLEHKVQRSTLVTSRNTEGSLLYSPQLITHPCTQQDGPRHQMYYIPTDQVDIILDTVVAYLNNRLPRNKCTQSVYVPAQVVDKCP
jgi:hypothetical protein